MSVKKNTAVKKAISEQVTPALKDALSSLKIYLGEKKFEKRIKKAIKVMTQGIKPKEEPKSKSAKTAASKPLAKKRLTAKKQPAATK